MFGLYKLLVSIPLVVAIANPQFAWELTEGWKYKNAETSPTYLLITRLSAAFAFVLLWSLFRH